MTISNTPRPAYIYDAETETWYPISSPVNTAANYDWSGSHVFASPVSFDVVLKAKAGVNNFQNPAARDAAIQSPANGTVVFVRQDANANTINQIQYYFGGAWVNYNNIKINEQTSNYTIQLHDADKLIKINSSSTLEVRVPSNSVTAFPIGTRIEIGRYGTGEVSVIPVSGSDAVVRALSNSYIIPGQYGTATITKIEDVFNSYDKRVSVRFNDGTATLPSLSFIGDNDTGVYRQAANSVGLAAGGVLSFAARQNDVISYIKHNFPNI
jgi:hypothetical protein